MQPIFRAYDKRVCLNCETDLPTGADYCPSCGQQNREQMRTVWGWVSEGLATFLHVEGKTWNTIRDLYVPGRLAKNYLNGQRQQYVHPLRLLLLSSLIFFAAMSSRHNRTLIRVGEQVDDGGEIALTTDGKSNSDFADIKIAVDPDDVGSTSMLKSGYHPLEKTMRNIDVIKARIIAKDLLEASFDTLYGRQIGLSTDALTVSKELRNVFTEPDQSIDLSISGKEVDITARALATKTPAELALELAPDDTFRRLVIQKFVQALNDGVESIRVYLEKNLSWVVLIFVPIMGFGYFLFYRKRIPYYSQALTFTTFNTAAILLAFVPSILLSYQLDNHAPDYIVSALAIGYLIANESKTFNYPWYKTILKSLGLALFSFTAFLASIFIWLLLALLLF